MVAMTTRAAAEEPLGALGAALSGTTADDAGEQLAERAGLSVGAISRLERGVRRSPRVQTLYPTRSRAARGHGSPPSTQRPWRRAGGAVGPRLGRESVGMAPQEKKDRAVLDGVQNGPIPLHFARSCRMSSPPHQRAQLCAVERMVCALPLWLVCARESAGAHPHLGKGVPPWMGSLRGSLGRARARAGRSAECRGAVDSPLV